MFKILDCTLRDGGYVNNWKFTEEQVKNCYIECSNSNIEYMEIGFRNFKTDDFLKKYGDTFFCTEEYINKVIGDIEGCKISVMVTINKFNINDFVPKKESKISLVRVLMDYHGFKNVTDEEIDIKTLNDGINQINKLIELGYDVSFNIGRIEKLSLNQLEQICTVLSNTKIKYFYMADTYGTIDLNNIEKLIPYVKNFFKNTQIELGLHAHDNLCNATTKSLYSLKFGINIIDGCIFGYGRGSGNAKTELLLMDLNKNYGANYNIINIISYGNKYIKNYKDFNELSYNPIYAICSYIECHVNYGIEIIEKHKKMEIEDVYECLKIIKNKNKHMFFYDNLFLEIYDNC